MNGDKNGGTPDNNTNNNNNNNDKLDRSCCNFWRSFDVPLIYCEIELDLKWSSCAIFEISKTPKVGESNPVDATETNRATSKIKVQNVIGAATLFCYNKATLQNVLELIIS